MTPADAEDWRRSRGQGQVFTEQHDSGMTVAVCAALRDRFGVQAGWEDNHTTAAVVDRSRWPTIYERGCGTTAHGGSVNDLRVATEELDEYAHTEQSPRDRRSRAPSSGCDEPEQAEIRAQWDAKANTSGGVRTASSPAAATTG
ncbi:hypothetical protein GTA09_20895 [Rhodococcus hoagii]|nr:hypothetical protein [Prescottella equi]